MATVLLVEDDELLLDSNRRLLARAGHQVRSAVSFAGVGEQLSSVDVVITDLSLPGIAGTDVLMQLRESDRDIPIIVLTGKPSVDSAAAAVELGAARYLVKPVEPSVLLAAVAHAVEGAGGGRTLASRFARACETLWFAYQPIVDWQTRTVFGWEALVRGSEPGLARPDELLDAAGRLSRLQGFGRAVRGSLAERAGSLPAGAALFVNLHPTELSDPAFFTDSERLHRHAGSVVLEITERASLADLDDVAARVESLRARGYRIAIDDMGAGYSGLSALTRLRPDVVKLDMSLVRNVQESATQRAVVRSITALCHELGFQVVAEGVETAAERDTLVTLGVRYMQGYLFARPDPALQVPSMSEPALASGS